jgi:hypothetical protein
MFIGAAGKYNQGKLHLIDDTNGLRYLKLCRLAMQWGVAGYDWMIMGQNVL